MINETSIHPRVRNGRQVMEKSNTCSPRSSRHGGQGGKKLRRAMKQYYVRLKDWEATTGKDAQLALAFRKPGSMRLD